MSERDDTGSPGSSPASSPTTVSVSAAASRASAPTAPAQRGRRGRPGGRHAGRPGAPAGERREPTVPARHAIVLVASVLALLVLLQAPAMVHAGEGMPPGTTRDLVLGFARPVDQVTGALRLDRPAQALAGVFGNDPSDAASSELVAGVGQDSPPPVVGGAGPGHPPGSSTAPAVTELRRPTADAPLRVLVTGDSLTESIGPAVASVAGPAVRSETDTRFGTGLVRPDYFDWAAYARTQLAERDPEAVVVALGGNDGQGFTLPGGTILSTGTPEWVEEYRRRAIVVMRIWTDGGTRRVYWLSMPPARSGQLDGHFQKINEAVADAARRVAGVTFIDLAPRLSDNGGYNDYLRDNHGNTVLARTRDGVHLTLDGARIAAAVVAPKIRAEWKIDD